VPADADPGALRPVDHHRRVPADEGAVAAFERLIAREVGLGLRRDRVDVVGRGQARNADVALAGPLQQGEHQVAGPCPAALVDGCVQRREPLGRLLRIDVRQLTRQAVADDRGSFGHLGLLGGGIV
jgi:hypothetical protein